MEIHKPKPWHGFREFAKEYLIIVVGVLTALGAEAVVEALHWNHEVHVAKELLAFDMRRVMGWSGAQDAQAPCVGKRLAQIDAILDQAQSTGRLPAVGLFGPPGRGSWAMRSWSGLTYGQTLGHFSNEQQLALSAVSLQVNYMNQAAQEESDDWAALESLSGPGARSAETRLRASGKW